MGPGTEREDEIGTWPPEAASCHFNASCIDRTDAFVFSILPRGAHAPRGGLRLEALTRDHSGTGDYHPSQDVQGSDKGKYLPEAHQPT